MKDLAEGKCVLLRISTFPSPDPRNKVAPSLDSINNINTCKDEIYFFLPKYGVQEVIMEYKGRLLFSIKLVI